MAHRCPLIEKVDGNVGNENVAELKEIVEGSNGIWGESEGGNDRAWIITEQHETHEQPHRNHDPPGHTTSHLIQTFPPPIQKKIDNGAVNKHCTSNVRPIWIWELRIESTSKKEDGNGLENNLIDRKNRHGSSGSFRFKMTRNPLDQNEGNDDEAPTNSANEPNGPAEWKRENVSQGKTWRLTEKRVDSERNWYQYFLYSETLWCDLTGDWTLTFT
jgi:hypothetical protein